MNKQIYLPQAKLFSVEWISGWLVCYHRLANAATLYLGKIAFSWRMPWLPHVVWDKGYETAWSEYYRLWKQVQIERKEKLGLDELLAKKQAEIDKLANVLIFEFDQPSGKGSVVDTAIYLLREYKKQKE